MLRFEEVSFRNFLSFGNKLSTFKLDSAGTTLIVGRNLDNPNSVSSNGSGKTTILQAISYALYNKSLSGISKERLINRTNDKRDTLMEVILKFTVNADEYTVRRYRGESYGAQIIKNGEDITPDSVSNIDAKIEEIIGISFELFTKIIVFTGSATSFLELPVAHQRNLIEELFKITALTKKATKLKEQIKDTETEISVANAMINQQKIAKSNQERHIEQALKRVQDWDSDTATEIMKLQADLEEASKIDFEKEQRAHAKLAELLKEQTDHQSVVRANTRELRAATTELTRLQGELSHLVEAKCPYCLQKYADGQSKIVDIESTIASLEATISTRNTAAAELEAAERSLVAQIEEVSLDITCPDLDQMIQIHANRTKLEAQLESLQSAFNPHIAPLESLMAEETITLDTDKVDRLNDQLTHEKFLLKLLTDKNSFIRKRIISKTVPFLNKQITHYLGELDLPHTVKFMPDMSCEISEYGRSMDHGNLSKGEQKKVNIALSLAFRDVLFHLHSPVSVMFCDELDSGNLDPVAVDSTIRLVKHKCREDDLAIYVISHRPEFEGRMDRTVTVIKEKGFSDIFEEEELV